MVRRSVRSALVLAVAGLLVGVLPAGGARAALPVPVTSPGGSGAYVGPGDPGALQAFGAWRGRPAAFATDYVPSTSWAELERPLWTLRQWSGTRTPLVLGVPMLVDDPVATLQREAAGAYDAHFRRLAQTLVAEGYAGASLRVGWEMNGDWFRWSAVRDPAAWKTAYRRIVRVMRGVPGAAFRFDWNVNLGSSAMPASAAYPGDAYVDDVGVDVYDWEWAASTATPQQRWSWIRTQAYGLDWVAGFASTHRKGVTVPEWGLAPPEQMQGGGGGDDPYYVRSLLAWAAHRHATYQSYFNWREHRLDTGGFPAGAAAYRAAA